MLNHFEVGPVCDVTFSLLTKPSLWVFFFLGANNSRDRAGRARHADRQTGGKRFSLNKGEDGSPAFDLRLSFCEDRWSDTGGIQPEKYNYISWKDHLTNRKMEWAWQRLFFEYF